MPSEAGKVLVLINPKTLQLARLASKPTTELRCSQLKKRYELTKGFEEIK